MNLKKKILLVSSPRPNSDSTPFHFGDGRPPLGLSYLAEHARRHGHDAKVVDLFHFGGGKMGKIITVNSEVSELEHKIDLWDEIDSYKPDFVGFYVGIISFHVIQTLIKEVRKRYPNITLLGGGPYISENTSIINNLFDHVVVGEGEHALVDILNGKVSEHVIQGTQVTNLDDLYLPNYDDFCDKPYNWRMNIFDKSLKKTYTINSTRGCPFQCRFCCVSNRKFRSVSSIKLVEYISNLKSKYNVDSIYFREDNFTVNKKRVKEFCNLMIENKINLPWACETRVKNLDNNLVELMAESGFIGAYVGVESGSNRMLSYMKKGETVQDFTDRFPVLHANGINTYTTWIYNLPTETKEDRYLSKKLAEKIKPNVIDNMVFLAIPGSNFYNMVNESGEYEFKEESGVIYTNGFLSMANIIWNDDRCEYVSRVYEKNGVVSNPVDF